MDIIWKKGSNEIERTENAEQMTFGQQRELSDKYDNELIVSYELKFKPNVVVGDVHNLENLTPENVESVTIIIGNKE
jgi:hypothetical protein